MTLRELFDSVLVLFGMECSDKSPTVMRIRALSDINAAIQTVAASRKDFFQREKLSVTLVAGTGSYDLDETILHLYGPAKINDGRPLTEILTRGEFDRFPEIYLGQTLRSLAQAEPVAIFYERTRRDDSNNVKITANVIPKPDTGYTLNYEASKRPAVFTMADVGDDATIIPMPHEWCESILAPLAFNNARGAQWFIAKDTAAIEARAREAMEVLGLAEPQIGGKQK